jgi:hypothetical protein
MPNPIQGLLREALNVFRGLEIAGKAVPITINGVLATINREGVMIPFVRAVLKKGMCVLLALAAWPAAGKALVLVDETFADGGRGDGADGLDVAWYTIGAPGSALVVASDAGGIGGGNAMKLSPTAAYQGFAAMLPELVSLQEGETLKLSFTFRFTGTTNLNQSGRLRFGFYNSWGTPTASDNNTVVRKNDDGYYSSTNPGAASASGTSLAREIGGSEVTMQSGATGFGTAGASVNGGTSAHTVVFTVTRSAGAMVVASSIDGQAAASSTDPYGPVTPSFDEVAVTFGINSPPSPMFIDNVKVEYFRPGLAERFTDGNRTDNAADADDTAWYSMGAAGTALSVADDAVIGSGNALKLAPTSYGQGFLGKLPSPVTLADGQSLKLGFQWRFTGTTNTNQAGRLRFGLYNSGGTPTVSDANTTTRSNDKGYMASTNPGADSSSGTTLGREAASDEILMGGGITSLGTPGSSINGGTSAHAGELTITRSGSALVLAARIDGQPAAAATDATPLTYTFDEVAFSIGLGNYTTPSPLVVDSVEAALAPGNAVGDGVFEKGVAGPAPSYGIGGAECVLVKNWDFGANGTIKTLADLNEHFQYYDQFNTYNVGGKYGASTVAPSAANGMSGQPVEGTATGGQPVREFFADSIRTYLVPLNGATTLDPALHNAGCGSFQAKWKLPNGGSRLGRDIIWETRVRYVTPRYFWFSLWTSGNAWTQGAEMDVIESFGYDNGGTFTNFDGRYWHSNCVGGSDASSYQSWSSTMASYGITSYDAAQYHTWTWHYRADNTFTVYVDGTEVQSGLMHWTNGAGEADAPIDMSFIFDAAWGHTQVSGVNHTLNASEFAGKYYEFDYSRVYLAPGTVPEPGRREPVADAYVRDGSYANSNYGNDTVLTAKLDYSGYVRESYLRFNVSGLANASGVRLVLTPVSTGAEGATTALSYELLADDSWTETGITWNNRPVSGAAVAASTGYAAGLPVELDITSQARAEAAGDGMLSLRIRSTSSGTEKAVSFGSRENGASASHPFLEITP